jgi:hypothetical protein
MCRSRKSYFEEQTAFCLGALICVWEQTSVCVAYTVPVLVLIDQSPRVFGIDLVCPYLRESCVCLLQFRVCNIPICIDVS